MASHNFQPPQQPEYTLPGIIHYLQREKTTIDRDRIQWENERGELKSKIGRLEGENQSLKEEVKQLRSSLEKDGKLKTVNTKSNDVSKIKFNNVDLNPLAKSKEKLKSQLTEISYLLSHTSIDHTAHLELNKNRAFFGSANSAISQTESDSIVETPLNSQLSPSQPPPNIQIDSPVDNTSKRKVPQLNQEDNTKVASPVVTNEPFNDFNDEPNSIESDAETVTGEPETDGSSSSSSTSNLNYSASISQITKPNHKKWQKFILTTHVSTINAVSSFKNGDILGSSDDGTIKLWNFKDFAVESDDVRPALTFTGETEPIFDIQCIDDNSFITSTSKSVKLWQKCKPTHPVHMNAKPSSMDYKDYKLLIVSDKTVSLNKIDTSKNQVRYQADKTFKPIKADHARFNQDGDIVTFLDNSCEIHKEDGTSTTPIYHFNIKESDEISNFQIKNELFIFTINQNKVLIFDTKIKKNIFEKNYDSPIIKTGLNKNHIIVILDNGEIKIYTSGKTDQVFEELNLFGLFDDISHLGPNQLKIFKGSVCSATVLDNNYVVVGCEDGLIRGFNFK
ncbi:putative WD repeat-containing protein [Wickerhamomyces ciferrii]|uniref:WD repeat-containing protein n=1 Tax=Wickerhamomyces ciferrii (strain ATCC 14091 / BCRC 22168 / CBS 111 / JCM 3599 / NBRC 0793 / NRRL Y-1031 F-60-10) TaxID=1206466 RepID=K0KVQ6_WICCF|nr:putative WD repeat-containing protein [Wickerhamomyces ciferrii]CCH46037.1 putative WD repeat-containing protein [Wickerhamomyces ciferrii]